MPVNRPLATLLAAIALLLAIVGAVIVLDEARQRRAPPARPTTGTPAAPRERAHANPRRPAPATPPADAQESVEPPPPAERLPWAPGAGFVVGTTTDAVDGEPAPDVLVRVLHPTGEEIATTRSDHAGRYQLEGVPETVPLVLEISRQGFLTGLCCDVTLRDAEIARKDVALLRSPRVRVELTAMPWERPAEGVSVRIVAQDREVVTGTTDAEGRVDLSVPELGRFDLRTGGGEWAPQPAQELVLLPGRGDVELRGTAVRGGRLVIDVVDDAGEEPVARASVSVHGRGLVPVSGLCDERGHVELGPFPPGLPLRVEATAPDGDARGASPAVARDSHDDDVSVVLRPAVQVAGVVLDPAARPIRGARVEVVRIEDGSPLGSAEVDAEGRFRVVDVPDALVEVVVRAPGFGEARVRTLPDGAVRVTMSRDPSGTLEGHVLRTDREPVAGAVVRVVPGDVRTATADDGSFELEGVPAGSEQRVLVEAEGLRVSTGGRPDRLVLQLAVDERRRLVVQMEPDDAEPGGDLTPEVAIRAVSGRLVRRTGAPVSAARVAWAGLEAVTGDDGLFRLERPARDARPARPLLAITPPAGLLEPATLPLRAPGEGGDLELGRIGLHDRPATLLRLAETPGSEGPSLTFALLFDTHDLLLGRASEPYSGRTAVTYDGTWLHVAAPGSWREGGHRGAWVGVVTPAAPIAAPARWPAMPDAVQWVAPTWSDVTTRVRVDAPATYRGGRLRLSLRTPPEGAPLERLGLPTESILRMDGGALLLAPFPKGVWQADLLPPEATTPADALPTLRTAISDGRVGRFRPAR